MSHERVKVSGIIEVESILTFEMSQDAGKHSWARLHGILTEEGVEKLSGSLEGEKVLVYDSETEEEIFHGIIDVAELKSENGYNTVYLELLAGSWLFDIEQKSQSFQDVTMTYKEVIKTVLQEYSMASSIIAEEMGEEPIGKPLIRYRETAWEFIGRLASHFNLPIFSDVRTGLPRIYVGVPKLYERVEFSGTQYKYSVGNRYMEVGGMLSGLKKKDFVRYDVEDGVNYRLGFETVFQDLELTICGKTCKLEKDVYVFTYLLANRKYCHELKRYNPHFLGMSLLGRVLHREGEHIRIHFDIDEQQDVTTCYPYPWKPEVGNLMYIAPQLGSRVSVYFGDDDESCAIATVNVRDNAPPAPLKGAELPPEPDYEDEEVVQSIVQDFNHGRRGLRTEHGKSFNLFPGAIRLNSNRGLGLAMNSKGVSFFSNANVSIIAKQDIHINASTVKVESKNNAYVVSGATIGEGGGAVPESGVHLFSGAAAFAHHGAQGDPSGGIKYLASSTNAHAGFFDDEPSERTFKMGRAVARAAGAAAIVVAVGGVIIITGGKGLVLAAGTAKKIGGSVIVTGVAGVAGELAMNHAQGVESADGAFLTAAMRGMFIGLVAGTAGGAIKSKALSTVAGSAGGGLAGQAADGSFSAEQLARDAVKSLAAVGITNALFPGSGTAINNAIKRAKNAGTSASSGGIVGRVGRIDFGAIQNLVFEAAGDMFEAALKAATGEVISAATTVEGE